MEREWITIQELAERLGTTQAVINKAGKGEMVKGHVIHRQGLFYAYDPPELEDDGPIDFEFVDLPTKKAKIDGGHHALGRLSIDQLNRIAKDLYVGISKDRFQLMSRIRESGPSGECRHCDAPRTHVIKDSTTCAFCLRDRAIDYKQRYTGKLWEKDGVKYPINPFDIPSSEHAALQDAGVSSTEELLAFLREENTILEALDALNAVKGLGPVGARRMLDWAKSQGWKESAFNVEDVQLTIGGVEVNGSIDDLHYVPSGHQERVAIIGSRSVTNYDVVKGAIWSTGLDRITEIVSGGAKGVDELAERYAKEKGIPVKVFEPDYETHGKSAPHVRNSQIIDYSHAIIAIWDGESPGTKSVIEKAQSRGFILNETLYIVRVAEHFPEVADTGKWEDPFGMNNDLPNCRCVTGPIVEDGMSGELGDDWSDVSGNPVEKEWTKEHVEAAKRLSLATIQTESELIDSILEAHEKATQAVEIFDGYCHAVSTADKDEDGSWEAARLLGVGSSDSPIILGASRFMTVEELYNVKLGHAVDDKPWLDVYRHFGTWFEVYVRDEIRRQWYPDLVDGKAIGILVSDVYPWMCANIDAFSPSERKLTEVKTRSKTKLEHADRIQVHHQMAVTGLESGEVVIVVPPMDRKLLMSMKEHLSCSPDELAAWILAHSEIVRHNVDCDEELLAAVVDGSCKFWDSVQAGITPEQEKCEELEAAGDLAEAFVLYDLGEIDREEFLCQVEAAILSPYIVRVRCDGHLVSRTQKGSWIIKMKTEEVEI